MPAGACAWARGMTPASRSAMPAPTMTRRAVRFIGHPPEFCGDAGNRPEPSGRDPPPSCRPSVSRATAVTEAAYAIAREHLVMPLTCDIGRQERDEVLERFRRGDIRTLVSARVLNEGLDVPDADILAIGAVLFAQRQRRARPFALGSLASGEQLGAMGYGAGGAFRAVDAAQG